MAMREVHRPESAISRQGKCGSVADRLMTAEEVAAWLQVTPGWVLKMARSGEIPTMKLGRYWRFESDAIADWLDERQQRTCTRRTGGG